MDFAAPHGTPVYAVKDGVIAKAYFNGTFGRYILLNHGGQIATAYAHLSRFASGIGSGRRVKRGDLIGYVGDSGRTRGYHLHFEVIQRKRRVNPMAFFEKSSQLSSRSFLAAPLKKKFFQHVRYISVLHKKASQDSLGKQSTL
jgi:murein DD-endopeptidase MepM/ murein hydrolase activator NlpD